MKRTFRKLHIWIAFPAGLVVTVLCLTGAILVFRAELEDLLYPERYFVGEVKAEKLPLHELMPVVNSQLDGDVAAGITISSDPERTCTVSIASSFHNPQFVDPYSGKLFKVDGSSSFFSRILQLHRWLLVDRQTGTRITGWTTLLFIVILITGAVITVPKSRKGLKRILKISVSRGWKRFWYDLHLSAGIYSWLLLMLLSLTALTWSFRWYANGVYKLFGVEMPVRRPLPPSGETGGQNRISGQDAGQEPKKAIRQDTTARSGQPARSGRDANGEGRRNRSDRGENSDGTDAAGRDDRPARSGSGEGRGEGQRPADFTHWQKVFDEVAAKHPNYRTISIRSGTATVVRKSVRGNARASDRYTFNEKTGEITDYQPYDRQPKASKMRGWLYTLHVGAWGGLFSKIITCLASLVGASLPLTGYYIWFKKRRKRKK
jgi:uncharacterized iron-regulated membrane protein